jgi:hypothetical protein
VKRHSTFFSSKKNSADRSNKKKQEVVMNHMLKETSVAKLKTLSNNAIKIPVGYPSLFSPSEELLAEFNEWKWKLIQKGNTESVARKKAWEHTDFEQRYRAMVTSKPEVLKQLAEIKTLSETQDVYLYCYCGKKPCHRFILLDIIKNMKTKKKIHK